jgi:hypothetical protein
MFHLIRGEQIGRIIPGQYVKMKRKYDIWRLRFGTGTESKRLGNGLLYPNYLHSS